MAIELSDPHTFRPVVTVVTVVIALFFVVIIIVTWSSGRGGRSSAEPLGTWSTWLELGGAARDVVDVVRGRRGCSISSVVGGHVPSSIAWGGKSPRACPAEVGHSQRSSLLA